MEGHAEPSSSCSTPYHSAPSSPSPPRPLAAAGCYFSAPTSPMHYLCAAVAAAAAGDGGDSPSHALPSSFEFEFSARCASPSAASAEDLFLNGQIRPTRPSSPLLSPPDGRGRDPRLRSSRSVHRRARSMSPLRNPSPDWHDERPPPPPAPPAAAEEGEDSRTPPASASSSRSSSTSSSSSGRSSRRWISLRDLLLHRSKSEGRANPKDRFWHLSPSKEKPSPSSSPLPLLFYRRKERGKEGKEKGEEKEAGGGEGKGARRRRARSAHERHYEEKRAEAEEMRKRTFLPYRAGLLGCLGFSSRSYGAVTGFARTWNAVGSR